MGTEEHAGCPACSFSFRIGAPFLTANQESILQQRGFQTRRVADSKPTAIWNFQQFAGLNIRSKSRPGNLRFLGAVNCSVLRPYWFSFVGASIAFGPAGGSGFMAFLNLPHPVLQTGLHRSSCRRVVSATRSKACRAMKPSHLRHPRNSIRLSVW